MDGSQLEKGTHIVVIGGPGVPDEASLERVDLYLRFGKAPAPIGRPDFVPDHNLAWEARPSAPKFADGRSDRKPRGNLLPGKRIAFAELVSGQAKGRTSADQITYSERGNLQGVQFYAVAGRVYELAKERGLGLEIPTSVFLQDIRS